MTIHLTQDPKSNALKSDLHIYLEQVEADAMELRMAHRERANRHGDTAYTSDDDPKGGAALLVTVCLLMMLISVCLVLAGASLWWAASVYLFGPALVIAGRLIGSAIADAMSGLSRVA